MEKKLEFRATTNNDSTVVVSGGVKKTTKQLAAGEQTRSKPSSSTRSGSREARPAEPKVKIKFAATDEFGQTATEEVKLRLCRDPSLWDGSG